MTSIELPPNASIPELFADGVLDIGFGNGVVRIDLFSLSATRRDPNGQPQPELRQRLITTPQGFLSGLAAMEGMCRRLEQAGVLAPRQPPATAPAADEDAERSSAPRSPNFG